jgi:hypothetical protein
LIHPQDWSLNSIYRKLRTNHSIMRKEECDLYVSYLQPREKVVLDVGAYNGDSARLFLKHGARKVICIEADKRQADRIKLPNTVVINERFKPEHLFKYYWDVAKINVESYEMVAYPYLDQLHKPIILESHGNWINDRFAEKGFQYLTKPYLMLGFCLMGRDGFI